MNKALKISSVTDHLEYRFALRLTCDAPYAGGFAELVPAPHVWDPLDLDKVDAMPLIL